MPFIDKYPTKFLLLARTGHHRPGRSQKVLQQSFRMGSRPTCPWGPARSIPLFRIGDRDAGTAAYTLRKEQQGMPPNWSIYIAVENADASTKRASELGGKVCMQPFDVFDIGRMAVVQDPTGATFCLWQAKQKAERSHGSGRHSLLGGPQHARPRSRRRNSIPACWDGNSRNRSTIRRATCTSKMASSSSEAFLPPNIAPPGLRALASIHSGVRL